MTRAIGWAHVWLEGAGGDDLQSSMGGVLARLSESGHLRPRWCTPRTTIAHSICIHVVPDFGGVLITMSSGRKGNPAHRMLSNTMLRYRRNSAITASVPGVTLHVGERPWGGLSLGLVAQTGREPAWPAPAAAADDGDTWR